MKTSRWLGVVIFNVNACIGDRKEVTSGECSFRMDI